jgi:hypothetical protein
LDHEREQSAALPLQAISEETVELEEPMMKSDLDIQENQLDSDSVYWLAV